jgi:dihydroflavonol-4-reductase
MDAAFVTGATGFVGANLVRILLAEGFLVRVLARPGSPRGNLKDLPVEIHEGDLFSVDVLKGALRGVRFAFHVAADYRIWTPDPSQLYQTNIEGTRNVLEAAAAAGAERIIHCSSVAAVRPIHGKPADETSLYASERDVIGHYKKSKYLAEIEALKLAARGLPIVVVNPSAPIGPYDAKPTPTGRIVVDFLNGRIPSYIDTGLRLVGVQDAARGHLLAALKGRVGERYILGGENLRLKDLFDILSEETDVPAPRFKTPYAAAYAFACLDTARAKLFGAEPLAPIDAVRMARHYMWFDSSKAARELGFKSRPAREALAAAARWFFENGYIKKPLRLKGRIQDPVAA